MTPRHHWILFAVLVVAVVGAFEAGVYPPNLMRMLCLGLFASAFNLLIGYTGLTSFGHAMFFGGASYACAHAAKVWALGPELSILVGVAFAAALGGLVGALAIRRQGIYFAMITLGFAQMFYFYCLQAQNITGGEDGIQAVPRGHLFGIIDLLKPTAMYSFVAAVFFIGFFVIYRTIHSPFGHVLQAIRENEARATSLGYKTDHYKLIAFVLSATLAGLAGATKSLVVQNASLTDVHWTMSGEVVLMTLIGGMGQVTGPLVGAIVIVVIESAALGGWVTVVEGIIFVVCVLTFRQGIIGKLSAWVRRPL